MEKLLRLIFFLPTLVVLFGCSSDEDDLPYYYVEISNFSDYSKQASSLETHNTIRFDTYNTKDHQCPISPFFFKRTSFIQEDISLGVFIDVTTDSNGSATYGELGLSNDSISPCVHYNQIVLNTWHLEPVTSALYHPLLIKEVKRVELTEDRLFVEAVLYNPIYAVGLSRPFLRMALPRFKGD